jgi:hypothetical protein
MRKIIIAGLAMLMTLGSVLGAVLGSASSPAKAATTAIRVSATATAAGSTFLRELTGVSCVSANFCVAVGDQAVSERARYVPIATIWNGARWGATATPLPKGWPGGELLSVSCTSRTYCVAVGNYLKSNSSTISSDVPVAVTWNGRAWTARALPSLAGGRPIAVGVSCAAARRCVVGMAANPMPKSGQAFIDVLTGAKWTVHALTPPKGSEFAGFETASCVSVTHCVIAGVVEDRLGETPLLALWNGKALSTMKADARFPVGFVGLSCASAKSCVAVGTWFTGSADLGYYGIWNGSVWRGARVRPQPKAMVVSNPLAVSCAVPTKCLAVGYDRAPVKGADYPNRALAEFFNGKSWTRLSVPVPAGAADTDFFAVSCLSATRCVAVGTTDYGSPSPGSAAALTGFWNGKSWRLVPAS